MQSKTKVKCLCILGNGKGFPQLLPHNVTPYQYISSSFKDSDSTLFLKLLCHQNRPAAYNICENKYSTFALKRLYVQCCLNVTNKTDKYEI